MPGIPCVYYGSEWGAKAHKNEDDSALRACFDAPMRTNYQTIFLNLLMHTRIVKQSVMEILNQLFLLIINVYSKEPAMASVY